MGTRSLYVPPQKLCNPFHLTQPRKNVLKVLSNLIIGGLVAPVRALFIVISLLLASALGRLAVVGLSPADVENRPHALWRKYLFLYPISFIARFVLFVIGYHAIREEGSPDPRARVIVANHTSLVEIGYLFWKCIPSFVSKHGAAKAPLVGTGIIPALQTILVNRDDHDSREKTRKTIVERARTTIWPPVAVFPEGTVTNGEYLLKFRTGAFDPMQPVQPVVIRYPRKDPQFNPSWIGPVVAGINAKTFLGWLWGLLSEPSHQLHIQWLPAMEPGTAKNSEEFAEQVRVTMAKVLARETVSHSYGELFFTCEARKKGVPSEVAGAVELQVIQTHYGSALTRDELIVLLQRFVAEVGSGGYGRLYYGSFCKLLKLEDSAAVRDVYGQLNTDSKGLLFPAFLSAHLYYNPVVANTNRKKEN